MTRPEPERRARRHAVLVALACGLLYLALIVAAFGMTALATNTEIVPVSALSEYVGPAMAVVAVAVLTVMLVVRSPRPSDVGLDWGYSLLVGFAALLSYLASAFVFGIIDQGVEAGVQFGWLTVFGGYDVLIGLLAASVALLYSFIIARRYDERGRPRWTWEDDFDV